MGTSLHSVVATLGRNLDPNDSIEFLAVVHTVFFSLIVVLAVRFGSPRTWPLRVVAATAGFGVAASLVWLWIDHNVEGNVLLAVSYNHGVTVGDMLALPMLVVSALVVAVRVCPAPARSIRNEHRVP